jgi:hypothetical protein
MSCPQDPKNGRFRSSYKTEEERAIAKAEYARSYRDKNRERKNAVEKERARRLRNDPEFVAKCRARSKASKLRHPDTARNGELVRRFGITLEDYNRMLSEQNHACAICGRKDGGVFHRRGSDRIRRFNVDHCHATGKIRGLLCWACNTVLGKFRDDPDLFERAAAYLRRAKLA